MIFSVVMFLCAIIFFMAGLMIYRGRIDLIHAHRQKNVKDKTAYGKSMGTALNMIGAVSFISGLMNLDGRITQMTPVWVFIIGLAAGLFFIWRIQKK